MTCSPGGYKLREQSMGTIYEADYYELRAPWLPRGWQTICAGTMSAAFRLFSAKHATS